MVMGFCGIAEFLWFSVYTVVISRICYQKVLVNICGYWCGNSSFRYSCRFVVATGYFEMVVFSVRLANVDGCGFPFGGL
ncbi:unnamed protein product [Schistosoma spindalis]|nr:unnamed protein product [Schistosoma spindale]CAI2735835.1 unnamed protein product [Schistosoma spindale]